MKIQILALLLGGSPAFAARGVYEVPVPAELQPFARYQFDQWRVRAKSQGRYEVRYMLPVSLTGEEHHLRFEGPVVNGVMDVTNESGHMVCEVAARMCRVKYERLAVNAAKAEADLRSEGFSESEISARLLVTARFGGDMEGVLYFGSDANAL